MAKKILVAGANGNMGQRVCAALLNSGAEVRALVRPQSDLTNLKPLEARGLEIIRLANWSGGELARACRGVEVLVSTLLGLRDVIVDLQSELLRAAVKAGVPRFIPSDYCIDFRDILPGTNRNLDLHREFQEVLDGAPIAATSIFNGAFADLLTGQAPFILFKIRRVLYWGSANQSFDFTTMNNTAEFTARAALDDATPRFLTIAGDRLNAQELAQSASRASGEEYKTLRAGTLSRLSQLIRLTRWLAPQEGENFPAWQGMQYMRTMSSGEVLLLPLDNARYPEIRWTKTEEVLKEHFLGLIHPARKM